MFASVRASNAAWPAGRIRPSAVSRATFSTLMALQLLPFRRGVKRCTWVSASTLFRIPSIQPTQRASSTARDQSTLGRPVAFLW